MASSENMPSLESLLFRPFQDSWISDACARDTETLTRALQKSLYSNNNALSSDSINPFLNLISSSDTPTPTPTTPTATNVSGSDPETVAPKRHRNVVAANGKVSKRKSRASKRSQTTFITADPANFRQMVQQVTGVRFGNAQLPSVSVLKPEPQRPGNRLHGPAGCLPTLDTSAFLLDHIHQQQQQQMVVGGTSGPVVGPNTVSFPQPVVADDGPATGLDFDTFSSFPTLESWKVM